MGLVRSLCPVAGLALADEDPQGMGLVPKQEFPDFLQEIWMEISPAHDVSFPDSLYLTCSLGIWV